MFKYSKGRFLAYLLLMTMFLSGCSMEKYANEVTITLFAAKSLNTVMDELIEIYCEDNSGVKFITNYDSSGTLQTQIEEGASCDIFFSAAQKQMNTLEEEGMLIEGSRSNLLNNQVCIVATKGNGTSVTGIDNLDNAESIALAAGSVPVGKYTREALVRSGLLKETDDPSAITTKEISEALNDVSINECANVGTVAAAVSEGSNEVGTVYYSDYKGYEDKLDIIYIVPYELTGNVIYPIAQVNNKEASQAVTVEAGKFISFLKSDRAKAVFEKYYFDTNVD